MNTVSLFLYAAEVLSKVQGLFVAAALLTSAYWGARMLITALHNDSCYMSSEKKPYPTVMKVAPLIALFSFIACIIPSKDTMYLIAGSEIAEVVVTSEEGKEVFNETKNAILRVVKGIGTDAK